MMIGKPLGPNRYVTGRGIGINSAQPSRIQYRGNASLGSRTFGTGLTTRTAQGPRPASSSINTQQDARNDEILKYLSSIEDEQTNEIIPAGNEDERIPEILRGEELSLKLQRITKQIAKQKGDLKGKQEELSELEQQEKELKKQNQKQESIIEKIVSNREKIESAIEKLEEEKADLKRAKDEIKSNTRLLDSPRRKIAEELEKLKRDNSSDSKESEEKSDSSSDQQNKDEPKEEKKPKIEPELTPQSESSHPKKKGKKGKKGKK